MFRACIIALLFVHSVDCNHSSVHSCIIPSCLIFVFRGWKNGWLNCKNNAFWQAHEDLDKAQGKLKHEQRFGSGMLKSVTIAVSRLTDL